MKTFFIGIPVLLSVVLFGFGCNPVADLEERAMKGVVEKAIENNVKKETGKDVDLDFADGGFVVNGENGETLAIGENVKIPSDFPSDVPRYSPSTAKSVSVNAAKQEVFAVLAAEASTEDVVAWYKDQAQKQGWVQKTVLELGAGNYNLSYEREDGSAMNVLISSSEGEKEVGITLTRTGKK